MKFTVQLVIEPGDGSTVVTEMASFEREALTEATLGLTLAESKTILAQLQERMVAQQAASYSTAQQTCPACGAARRCKGHHHLHHGEDFIPNYGDRYRNSEHNLGKTSVKSSKMPSEYLPVQPPKRVPGKSVCHVRYPSPEAGHDRCGQI